MPQEALIAAVNKAADAIKARFAAVAKGSMTPIPSVLQDEVRRLAAVKPATTVPDALKLLKDMAPDAYKLRAAALLGNKPKATRFQGLGPTDPREVIEDKALRGSMVDGFQTLLPAAAAVTAAGEKLDLPANVLAALEV